MLREKWVKYWVVRVWGHWDLLLMGVRCGSVTLENWKYLLSRTREIQGPRNFTVRNELSKKWVYVHTTRRVLSVPGSVVCNRKTWELSRCPDWGELWPDHTVGHVVVTAACGNTDGPHTSCWVEVESVELMAWFHYVTGEDHVWGWKVAVTFGGAVAEREKGMWGTCVSLWMLPHCCISSLSRAESMCAVLCTMLSSSMRK